MKRKFNIGVVWTLMGSYDVEAEDEFEAAQIARESPLPNNGEYLENSFEIDFIKEKDGTP